MSFLGTRARTRSRKASSAMTVDLEKWRSNRKLSRRDDITSEDEEDDDEGPQFKEITDWVQEFFNRKSDTTDLTDQDAEVHLTKKQTLILSTLVPDEILHMDKFETTDPKRFVGVLMMADVSGYTALSERYNNTGKGGTYRLTVTLNTYLGSLIELIYSHGGDVIKFAGDAFLALWKTDKRTFLCHTIHSVITCALIIQHSYSSYETDVKVNLRVKLAISAGNLIFTPIGSGIDMNYIIFGLPVIEAKAAESVCASGQVKLTPTAWGHCYSRNYDHDIDEKGYVTIKAILYDPRDNNVTKPFVGLSKMIVSIKKPFPAIENFPDDIWDSSNGQNVADTLKKTDALNLRKTIILAEEKKIGSHIRKFMIRPVVTQIDAHQPLEYLTEMRPVSILFLTLKPRNSSFAQLITIVNNAYQITCEIVCKSMGCVNKIILFDKDIMMLVVFGLRGFKHESEAQAALKCAYNIRKSVSALDGVVDMSIGVTTGPVYCGVIGHPLRREFTVIGAIVNKAARLMCVFKNKITCDEATFVKSKMSSNAFTLQPSIELKGIGKSGKIYEYTEEIRVKELFDIPMIAPLLDRVDEVEYFENWLDDFDAPFRDFDALLIVGESRVGKTRLLEWMARSARNKGFHVCSLNLTSIHSATAYLGLSQLMNQIFQLQEPIQGFAKEEKIVQILQVYSEDLCYLNNIIKVRFAYHEGIQSLDENRRREKAKLVFTKLVKAIKERYVIFLDDLQNLDPFSWEFISVMFNSLNIFTVLSVTRGRFNTVHNWLYRIFIDSNIRKISLSRLDNEWIPALACQILDVDGVSNELCKSLQHKCKGMPGLVESLIIHLFSNGGLEIKSVPESELHEYIQEDLIFPDPVLLHPQAVDANYQETLDEFIINNPKDEKSICLVIDRNELKVNLNVQNLDALIMIQIDSLTPYQQLLLKIASVIGQIIPRDLIENIMYENDRMITAKAVRRLFTLNILSCANIDNYNTSRWGPRRSSNMMSTNKSSHSNLLCDCKFEHIQDENENLPKFAFCKLMRFRNKNSRNTCYELLPMNQKKEFHSRIVNYLENSKQVCTSCGGKLMFVPSLISLVDMPTNETDLNTVRNIPSMITLDEEENSEILENPLQSRQSKSKRDTVSSDESNNEYISKTQFQPILKSRLSQRISQTPERKTKKVTMTTSSIEIKSGQEQKTKIFDLLRAIVEAESLGDWHTLGVLDSQEDARAALNTIAKESISVKLAKGVSETNFDKCTCTDLNITICEQIVYHAQQAELKEKAIEFQIKYSYLCVISNNLENILTTLDAAEKACTLHGHLDLFDEKLFRGRINSIRAATYLMLGKFNPAKLEIERAIKIYGININKVAEFLGVQNITAMIRLRKKKYRIYRNIMKVDSIFCLNVATLIYSSIGDYRQARITALRALDILSTVDCSVIDLCETFSNAIQIEIDRGTPENTEEIEQMAVQAFKKLPKPIESGELFSLGKLYMSLFRARISRGQLAASARSGFRALAISRFLHAENISLEIIPDLFYILLARRRIGEAVDVLQYALRMDQISYISHESETWYYALCLDLILDAGFQLESPQDINRFAESSKDLGEITGSGRRRLIVGLWTYWLRADQEKKAKRFESEALSWVSNGDEFSLRSLLSAMRLAEGMLESLARKVDDLRKVVDLMELRSIADRELNRLENDAKLLRSALSRWSLLKANSAKLSGRLSSANAYFNQAIEEARRTDNQLEEHKARAYVSNSLQWVQNARAGTFKNWRSEIEIARNTWHLLMYRISTTRY